ncbi:hypothetical protein K5X82_17945 [Halosquirtibacter xylanolyticus]|uniref:hypothetical protein n=1 Tax=Halosquirtibacter xylanolyticus TaxID=3374599 RepID=UPI003749A4E1|nr:hypothetical protein K5X82_17945 [Prolixibacteraceae bacterium]
MNEWLYLVLGCWFVSSLFVFFRPAPVPKKGIVSRFYNWILNYAQSVAWFIFGFYCLVHYNEASWCYSISNVMLIFAGALYFMFIGAVIHVKFTKGR